ncbi:hypothetical protein ABFX02_04G226800 [Erythranthe guttata]
METPKKSRTHVDAVNMTSRSFHSSSSNPTKFMTEFKFSLKSNFSVFEEDSPEPKLVKSFDHPTQVDCITIDRSRTQTNEARELIVEKLENWRVPSYLRQMWIDMALQAADDLRVSMAEFENLVISIDLEADVHSQFLYDEKPLMSDKFMEGLQNFRFD